MWRALCPQLGQPGDGGLVCSILRVSSRTAAAAARTKPTTTSAIASPVDMSTSA